MTDAEHRLWYGLRARRLCGYRFRRQEPIGGYIVDFACLEVRLVVEVDGGQHLEQRRYDLERTSCLEALVFRVIRFWNDRVLVETEAVLDEILRVLQEQLAQRGRGDAGQGKARNAGLAGRSVAADREICKPCPRFKS